MGHIFANCPKNKKSDPNPNLNQLENPGPNFKVKSLMKLENNLLLSIIKGTLISMIYNH